MRGRWAASDVVIPLFVLTFSQWEVFVVAPNLSHGPLPLLFAMLLALAVTGEEPRRRLAATVVVSVLGIETGFGVFLAAVAVPVLAVLLREAVRTRRDVGWHVAALALVLGAVLLYFVGFVFMPSVACFRFPDPEPIRYLHFLTAYFVRPLELQSLATRAPRVALSLGFVLAATCAGLAAWAGAVTLRTGGRSRRHVVVFVLSGFSLAFALNAAIGRACVGPELAAGTPRYVPYQLPFWVALYVAASFVAWRGLRVPALAILTVLAVLKETPSHQRTNEEAAAAWARGKRAWVDCYRASADVAACQRVFRIYPDPAATHLEQKLTFLRAHQLSFFKR
jgi:hypothetical protein